MKFPPSLFLILMTALGYCAYYPGLGGDFLFDDSPNLKYLGELGGVKDWQTLKAFILSGWSGPTGRPISLLSFLINDNNWPSIAKSFKYTNLCLHLICGLLLAWASYLLLLAIRFNESRAAWVATLTASIWMLHPYWVSTTLYVVQRMTILSALFMLLGIIGYLKGRLWLMQPILHRPQSAYALMTISAGMGSVLAVLSKENGALLPLLLFVIETFIQRMNADTRPNKIWLGIVLGLPSLFVLTYLAAHINFSENIWPTRPFNQVERIYSESRILWNYIRDLFIPRIEGAGLFQDGFEISRGLLAPKSTFLAILGWAIVILALPLLYTYHPFYWLAAVFFLCGHLIESTVIGLELHFEHRNYLPSIFLFLPIAICINWMRENISFRLAIIATISALTLLASMTWQRSLLWSNSNRLQTYWAMYDPQSARGRNYLLSRLVNEKKYDEAVSLVDKSINDLPHSSLMTINWLRVYTSTRLATDQHFEKSANQLINQAFDAQTVAGLRTLVDDTVALPELAKYHAPLLNLLNTLSLNGPYRKFPLFLRVIAYNKARLHLLLGNIEEAQTNYLEAIQRYGRANSALQMFSEMAIAGHTASAQILLDNIKQGIDNGSLNTKPLGKHHYQQEVRRMQEALTADSNMK